MPLSCFGKKGAKDADLRGAELIAPAINAALLRISRRASPQVHSSLHLPK